MLEGLHSMFFKDYFKVFRTIHSTRGSAQNLPLPKVRTETARKSFILMDLNVFIILQVKWRNVSQLWFLKLVFWNYIDFLLPHNIHFFLQILSRTTLSWAPVSILNGMHFSLTFKFMYRSFSVYFLSFKAPIKNACSLLVPSFSTAWTSFQSARHTLVKWLGLCKALHVFQCAGQCETIST